MNFRTTISAPDDLHQWESLPFRFLTLPLKKYAKEQVDVGIVFANGLCTNREHPTATDAPSPASNNKDLESWSSFYFI